MIRGMNCCHEPRGVWIAKTGLVRTFSLHVSPRGPTGKPEPYNSLSPFERINIALLLQTEQEPERVTDSIHGI